MKKILIIKKIHDSGLQLLDSRKDFSYEIVENIENNFLKNKLKNCDAISLRTSKFTKELIELSPKLKIISRHGVGYDNVDLEEAKKKNITISITSNSLAATVAEHVFFMMLSISRGTDSYNKSVKDGNFSERKNLPLSKELWKKNILILGFGRIGKNLIKKCIGFEMNVFVYDPFVDKKIINDLGGKKADNLYDTIKEMDYLSIHMPLTEKTKNLINLKVLSSMKKNSIIINTSRGGIINEIDLNEALNKSMIFGAGLDVFEKEPPDRNNPLLKNKKVFLSPHTSTFTEECTERMGIETAQNIIDFFENKLEKNKIIKL
tara:strand:- start:1221 stop:2177 length:957 start_codon:yes stop_codon:yes gene_type:complete